MPIDTGDLTKKTYDAIIVAAERFKHDLTLASGMLSYQCDEELARQMLKYDENHIDDLFFGNPPPREDFIKAVEKILSNIGNLKNSRRSCNDGFSFTNILHYRQSILPKLSLRMEKKNIFTQ